MAYVQVDVDIDEFETNELVDELVKRFNTIRTSTQLTNKQKSVIRDAVKEILPLLGIGDHKGIPDSTLEDKMKRDVVIDAWERFTSYQMEERLK